eukprot:TRINITY_DN38919_c0_g1_i1.p1 TRINITY_DN38919_c0_g1~~TRINITY_DN38919_c0_g1_i1.p1  ORF type:complete len:164 (-),score=8.54 TRINITY_DN38919_c0_g1_i1:101-592(-)
MLGGMEEDFVVFVLAGQSNMVGRGVASELSQDLIDFVHCHADVRMAYDIDKNAKEQTNSTSGRKFLQLGRQTQWSDGGLAKRTHTSRREVRPRALQSRVRAMQAPRALSGRAGARANFNEFASPEVANVIQSLRAFRQADRRHLKKAPSSRNKTPRQLQNDPT